MRVCLVTPFAWSQPHDVNDHVAGVADALRRRGHEVTVVAPSARAADLLAGRRALASGTREDVIAVGAAVPVSRRSQLGVPVGVQANLRQALGLGFDVVHGFEPALPSLSYLALRDADALAVATFVSPNRLGYPPARSAREKLLARIDALVALSPEMREAAEVRFPGDYRVMSPGVDTELFAPSAKRNLVVLELRPNERDVARSTMRALRELPGWRAPAAHPPADRTPRDPARPRRPGARAHRPRRRLACRPPERGGDLRPGDRRRSAGHARSPGVRLRDRPPARPRGAAGAGRRRRRPPGGGRRPSRARCGRLPQGRLGADLRRRRAGARRALRVAREPPPRRRPVEPLADREWIVADLHMHTNWSHDCSIDPAELIDHAESEGLGAIAVTDHNVFSGALETVDLARARDLVVIPGEEVKTDGQGEVIGLFIEREIPRGMSFAETVAAIREQDGIVYVPHPFDRMHSIPDPKTLHRHLADIDVLEVYNARLLFEGYNDEALRFATKYNLTMGAGSDAHVLQGVGTGALRMRRFEDPEEFLLSLRTAEVLRRPKSLAYLQSLKWVAQVKERVR